MATQVFLDTSAIEKLIKNDPEFIVKIKKGVLENFTNKNIRGMLNYEEIKKEAKKCYNAHDKAKDAYLLAIKSEIEKTIGKVVDSGYFGNDQVIAINSAFKKRLQDQIDIQVGMLVETMIKDCIDEKMKYYKSEIKAIADCYFKRKINELVQQEFAKRLEKIK